MNATLSVLGLKTFYEGLASIVKAELGASAYQWPYLTGYSFTLPGTSPSGGHTLLAYIALQVDKNKPGKIRIYLQPRAIEAVGRERVEKAALQVNSKLTVSPAGYGDFWVDVKSNDYESPLRTLAAAISMGWQIKKESSERENEETGAEMLISSGR